MRRFITTNENSEHVNYNIEISKRNTALREKSVVDDFYFTPCANEDDVDSVALVDPIIILFNQQRLDDMGATAAKAFIDSLNKYSSNDLDVLRQKCSDEDLHALIKSRHLQSPAEILSWCRYMNSNMDKFNAELQTLVAAQTKEQQVTKEVTKEVEITKTE